MTKNPANAINTSAEENAVEVTSVFAAEILEGLLSSPKTLPSKYFYDQRGDELFQQIMQLDEYYLTRAEHSILQNHARDLLQHFSVGNTSFSLIELGAGDGYKTKVLLNEFVQAGANFTYVPIDISANAVDGLVSSVKKEIPEVQIDPLVMDYFQGLSQLSEQSEQRKVVLFLGSSIGNLTNEQASDFLKELSQQLRKGDLLLIGFDLVKDPNQILAAYDDGEGVTSEFNLNLLNRINRETGADFDCASFRHFALYEPLAQEARSYLISLKDQQVYFPEEGITVEFDAWEPIHTEISRKYTIRNTNQLAAQANCEVLHNFQDPGKRFLDALWRKK